MISDQTAGSAHVRGMCAARPAELRHLSPVAAGRHHPAAHRRRTRACRGPADSWRDLDLGARCITQGVPGSMLPGTSGNSYEIVQAPGYVAIRYERINEVRVIPLD